MHCEKCNYTASFLHHWNKHLDTKKHKESNIVKKCNLCNYSTPLLNNYKKHLENKVHQLLNKLTPTNYKTIILDGIDINKHQPSRGIVLNQFKILTKKYKFALMRGHYLYVYTTEWKKYKAKDIFIQLKEIYNYFEDYFLSKMDYEHSQRYKHSIDDGSNRTEVNENGKKIKKGLKGNPILKPELLAQIPTVVTNQQRKRLLYQKSTNQKYKEFLEWAEEPIETEIDKQNFKEFLLYMTNDTEWDEIYSAVTIDELENNLYTYYTKWYSLYVEDENNDNPVKPLCSMITLIEFCKKNLSKLKKIEI